MITAIRNRKYVSRNVSYFKKSIHLLLKNQISQMKMMMKTVISSQELITIFLLLLILLHQSIHVGRPFVLLSLTNQDSLIMSISLSWPSISNRISFRTCIDWWSRINRRRNIVISSCEDITVFIIIFICDI